MASWVARLRWGASQVPKSRAHAELSQLLVLGDLPGDGWRTMDERAWLTGKSGADGAWASRAKEAGLITAWRSFEQQNASRWLWVQATPLVSEEDAVDSLRSVPQRMLGNLRADVKLVSSSEVEAIAVASAPAGWACEQQTSSRRGDGLALYSAFVIGSTMVVLAASGLAGSWTWADVARLAQKQVDRLGS